MNDYPIQPISFNRATVDDSFWSPRLETNRTVTIPVDFPTLRGDGAHPQLRTEPPAWTRAIMRASSSTTRRLQGDRGRGLLAPNPRRS
ncbi:MAG: hypothetical protein R2838_18765 [Caldilineaceae bacterium]